KPRQRLVDPTQARGSELPKPKPKDPVEAALGRAGFDVFARLRNESLYGDERRRRWEELGGQGDPPPVRHQSFDYPGWKKVVFDRSGSTHVFETKLSSKDHPAIADDHAGWIDITDYMNRKDPQ